jgi:serine/threonine protein kinase
MKNETQIGSLAHYEPLKKIGYGTFGGVYEVLDTKDGTVKAMKIVSNLTPYFNKII